MLIMQVADFRLTINLTIAFLAWLNHRYHTIFGFVYSQRLLDRLSVLDPSAPDKQGPLSVA